MYWSLTFKKLLLSHEALQRCFWEKVFWKYAANLRLILINFYFPEMKSLDTICGRQIFDFLRGFNFAEDYSLKILRGLYFAVTKHETTWSIKGCFNVSLCLLKKCVHVLFIDEKKHEISLVIFINFLPSIFIFQIFFVIFPTSYICRMGNFWYVA